MGCFAHCRRYFFEAAICRYPVGLQGLLRIQVIYAVDRACLRAPREDRVALRLEDVGPLVEELFAWVHAARDVTPGRNLATKGVAAGVPTRTRFVWSHVTATSARWEQAYSIDGGSTWETNWIMELERLGYPTSRG